MDLLCIDLGNTLCKLRLFRAQGSAPPALLEALALESRPGVGEAASRWIEGIAPPDRAGLCSVGAESVERELLAVLEGRLAGRFVARPEVGLEIDGREPATVGRDRLFAALAALGLARGSALVVSAGTALTVDAVRAGARGVGTFLGGAIAPGPRALARALHESTARLPLVEPAAQVPALGTDTRAALAAGVAHGFRGATRELVERIAAEAGLGSAPVVLSGGARAFLEGPGTFGRRHVIVEPELVGLGLVAALRSG